MIVQSLVFAARCYA